MSNSLKDIMMQVDYQQGKKLSPARSALYRFGIIHKEISLGAYPNSNDLAAIIEVSAKTVLRDLDTMRDQFGFPIKYDKTLKGFYYDTTVQENFDLMYWQSIFDRMKRFAVSDSDKKTVYCSFIVHDDKMRKVLEKITNTMALNASINLIVSNKKKTLNPVCVYRESKYPYVVLGSQYEYTYFKLNLENCVYDSAKDAIVSKNGELEIIVVKCKSVNHSNDCFSNGNATICACCINGNMRVCSSPKITQFMFPQP